MDAAIPLTLDRPTAEALWNMLYEIGEHWAGGADLAPPPSGEMERLGRLLRVVDSALGYNTMRFS